MSGLEVVLERSDGRALLTIPDLGEQARLQSVLPLKDLPDSAWGVPGRLSGEPALVVSRPLIYQNLRISASLPESTALADWHRERNTLVAITLAFCLMVLVAGAMVVSFFNHITAARHAMAQSKVMLDQALESMVSGFVLLDQQHRVLHWNRRFEEIFPWVAGIMAPQLPFRRILEITVRHYLPQASEAEMLQWVELRLARQRVIDGVHEQEQPDGRCIQIVERPTPEGAGHHLPRRHRPAPRQCRNREPGVL